ncbi:MAG: sulfate adenylyltransferase subunit 2 [Euryarchaeota archaeon]|jgi:sulfate adenylyltransferase subunit 2|nr:sulfate adenylyltransferase subunit 2 [Euryarchaeota archaeon]MBT3972041.1 sulfate adenylyltransferase subunit 2 [Euryarchaeota archaeon]MBT4407067.1 sulfate adenylyltransferase subunit 2 [Euryarchaeota archaeon]MBT6645174.1 sulfate adenylyltransferase subunit 2 [Euryarchaeota archaeon]
MLLNVKNNAASSAETLARLEAEAIHILREIVAQAANPVILFSGGKDSICLLRLMQKAFWPAPFPVPLLHIDTGHNFDEVIEFRDKRAKELNAKLFVKTVEEAIEKGIAKPIPGVISRNRLQSPTLLAALAEGMYDAAIGGARRDEEKARAKERIFSFRDRFGQWQPRKQRPELWNLYNARVNLGENVRVFPLSNWTELDIWSYIESEKLEVPSIYFSHQREVFMRYGQWLPVNDIEPKLPHEESKILPIRVRTIGDIICTGCVVSEASSVSQVISEIAKSTVTERESRADDLGSETAMEDRKKEGYF